MLKGGNRKSGTGCRFHIKDTRRLRRMRGCTMAWQGWGECPRPPREHDEGLAMFPQSREMRFIYFSFDILYIVEHVIYRNEL
jgi:hypothetical protein